MRSERTKELWQRYGHWIYALILPVYLTLFFLTEHIVDGSAPYLVSYLPMDDAIPFCEWFYIAYLLWYPLLGAMGFYLAFTDPRGFKRYMTYIGISFSTAVVLFLLFPNGQDLRPDLTALGRDNWCLRGIAALYATDTNTNVCPSLHVVGCMAAVFAAFCNERLRRGIWAPVATMVLSIFIVASTVLIKQHSVLDILLAIPYGFITWLPVWLIFRDRNRSVINEKTPVFVENEQNKLVK